MWLQTTSCSGPAEYSWHHDALVALQHLTNRVKGVRQRVFRSNASVICEGSKLLLHTTLEAVANRQDSVVYLDSSIEQHML